MELQSNKKYGYAKYEGNEYAMTTEDYTYYVSHEDEQEVLSNFNDRFYDSVTSYKPADY